MVFLDPAQRIPREDEKARYETHDNSPEDEGYVTFLRKLADPMLERIPPNSQGLDYGCGPGPAMHVIFEEHGHELEHWDPFFEPDRSVFDERYDFITCSETAEHFHDPAGEFNRFDRMLRSGGWLAVMTAFRPADREFAGWHYRRDPTHAVFYREETFRWLARRFGWQCEFPAPDVFLAKKR